MDSDFAANFERRVGDELRTFPGAAAEGAVVGAAVSGGADSMALLRALMALSGRYGYRLEVLTVDHNMRSPEESGGDARFVREFCRDRGISCTAEVLEPGLLAETAAKRGRGIEEAARFLRYEILERFARGRGAAVVCLGHNRNDQLETLVQRFLQGGSGQGIRKSRGVFFRPLLGISRADIERYLLLTGTEFRTDKTNSDTRYLRNRLRLKLLPLLDEVYPGWDAGVLRGAEQAEMNDAAVAALVPGSFWNRESDDCVSGSSERFFGVPEAVRLKLLQQGLTELPRGTHIQRVPREMLMRAVRGSLSVQGCGIRIAVEGSEIRLLRDIAYTKRIGYFGIVKECGYLRIPAGVVRILPAPPGETCLFQGPFPLPLVIRSRREGDVVQSADGAMRSLKKLLINWKVPAGLRDSIPVIEGPAGICCVWGSAVGCNDWVVRDSEGCRKSGTSVYFVLLG